MTTMSGTTPCVLERPEVRAHPAEPGLHFVGDAHAAGGAHVRVHLGEIARRKHDLPADARARLGDEAGERSRLRRAARRSIVADVRGVLAPASGSSRLIRAAIVVGNRRDVHPVRRAGAARARVLVRADVDERRRVAVIRGLEDDHVARAACTRAPAAAPARSPRSPSSRRSRPSSGAGKRRRQPLGVLVDEVAQVARVRVEQRHLPLRRRRRRADGSGRRAARCCTRRCSGGPSSSNRYCIQPRTIFSGSR